MTIESLFLKYRTRLRDKPTTVTHAVYGTSKELTPLQFAVYETAMKAHALNWRNCPAKAMAHFDNTTTPAEDNAEWMDQLAGKDGIQLLYDPSIDFEQAGRDHYACVDWLTKEGLYYDLLD